MIWGDGLRVNPGALHARATELLQAEEGLRASLSATRSTDLGPWRGEAARAERDRNRRLTDAMERQAATLPQVADALSEAAEAFASIQQTQRSAISRATSWQYRYTDAGLVLSTVKGINLDPRRPFVRAQLQSVGVTVTLRLGATDLRLAGRLGSAAVQLGIGSLLDGVKNGLLAGGEWLGDSIMNGLDWAGDRIRDAYDWGQDRVQDVVDWFRRGAEAAGPAWGRFLDTLGTRPRWLTDFLERGEVPQVSELAAQGAFLTMQLLGAGADFLTGERHHFFDDGRPWVGDVQSHAQRNYTGVADVMQTAMDIYGSHDPADPHDRASVQVTAVEGADGTVRYIAAIPGTTEDMGSLDGWSGSESGTDWAANLKGVGYGNTSATDAAKEAIDRAIRADMARRGLTGTPELLLTGHSQGGIIAANIASDPAFAGRYDVRGIVSAGSPQQTIPVPDSVPVYNFQNLLDPVPRTDLGGLNVDDTFNRQPAVHNIVIAHSGSPLPGHTHSQEFYMEGIHDLANGGGTAHNQQQMADMNAELGQFFDGKTTGYRVEYGREVDR